MHTATFHPRAPFVAAEAARSIIARRMARALLTAPAVDPDDEVACLIRLGCRGFGQFEIADCSELARVFAGVERRTAEGAAA